MAERTARRCRARPTSRHRRRPTTTPVGPRRTGRPGRRGSPAFGRGSLQHGVEAYFGVRRENTRYLTGFVLGEGEEKVAGHSGQFLVGGERGRRPGRLALHDPGGAGGDRRPDRGRGLRPAGEMAIARGVGRREAGGRRGRVRVARAVAAARGGRAGRRAGPGRGLGRGGSRDQGAGRGRAGRGRLRGRRPGTRDAAAPDPAGRHGGGARARARVAAPDRRRGGRRLRPDLPGRPEGSPAARIAGRGAGHERVGRALRLRRAGRRAIGAT